MYIRTLLILMLMGFTASLMAQRPNIIPPSPSAASISKFGDIPVNLSIGSANISIPIYAAKEGTLNWNVNLDYNYTGYRPSDGPGWAGRGFSLPVGVITRTVHGLRDEGENGHAGYMTTGPTVNTNATAAENGTAPNLNFMNDVVLGNTDAEPDMFQFTFGNYSGKFFFKSDGTIYCSGNQALKIVPEIGVPPFTEVSQNVGTTFTKWTITTEDGTQFVFDKAEYGWTLFGNESFDHFKTTISAWHLSEITGINGDRITIAYTAPSFNTKRLQASFSQRKTLQLQGGGGPPNFFVNETVSGLAKNYSQEIFPTTISSSNWEIKFNSTVLSEFINSETSNYRQLNSIQISDKTSGAAVQVKKFDFTYNASDKHLLEKLQESNGSTSVNPYLFSYNSLTDVGVTASIDYWGYYNASGNSGLISQFGADRQPYLPGSQMGALQTLAYPTKGSSVFEYELNTASYRQTSFYQQKWLVYDYYGFVWRKNASGTLDLIQSQPFTINEPDTYETTYNFDFPYDPPCHPVTATGTFSPGSYTAADFTPHACFVAEAPVGGEIDIHITVKRELILDVSPVGGLRIKTIKNYTAPGVLATQKEFKYGIFGLANRSSGALADSIETSSLFTVVLSPTSKSTAQTWKSEPFNSLALSPIIYSNVEEITNNVSQYNYFSSYAQYGNVDGTLMGIAGTKAFGPVGNYDFARGNLIQTTRYKDLTHTGISTESFTGYGLTNAQSPGIYLELAAAYDTYAPGNPQPFTNYAYYAKAYRAALGWLQKTSNTERDYGTSGSAQVNVSSTYEYTGASHRLLTKQRVSQSDGSTLETNYKYPPEYSVTGNAAIQSMITAHMDSYPVETVTWLEKTPSDRRVVDATATSYKSVTGNSVKPALLLPYKKFRFKGMNGSIGTFTPYTGSTDETASASYRETLKYTNYDTQGNPLSLLINGIDKLSYLWSYKGQYPVAEIQNADNAQVLSALGGTSFTAMAAMTDSPTIQAKLDAVRGALTTAQVSSYLYSPLIGVSKTIDPAGKNLVYNYDGIGRLINIKDGSGNTRSSYCYNYAGQSVPCDAVSSTGAVLPGPLELLTPPPLPVKLINFNAVKEEKTALLSWNTTEETNSDRFDIEHSLDGKSWARIGSVEAKGESAATLYYSFRDGSPANGGPSHGENLYRLKMVDIDGSFAYSRIQSLHFDSQVSVYPNPVSIGQKLTLDIPDPNAVNHVKIYDVAGKVVYSSGKAEREIDVNALQPGIYIVQITGRNGSVSIHRIVKQ